MQESRQMANPSISHERQEETLEAKARWFQALPLVERMEMLCTFTDLILSANPQIVELKDAQPVTGRVRVLTEA
jgi:hypothetical protein